MEHSNEPVVRTATKNDLDDIMQIEKASFEWYDRFPATLFIHYLQKFEDGFFVALDPYSSIVGYAILADSKSVGYVLSIAVHPKFRNQGYAELLLSFVESKCREKCILLLRLDVRVDNVVAIELYKKLGFVQLRLKKDFYGKGLDALLMEKTLM